MVYIKDTNFLKKNLIAHRGVHNIKENIPENSIQAFKIAMEKNYIIELDLHILKDNNIIVFHDNNLFRMTGINKNLKDCTYSEIKKLKLQDTDNSIPLFKDVLKLVDGKVPLLIELKYDTKVGKLEKEVMKYLKEYKGKYAIMAFNPFSILYLKKEYPNVIRGQLACNLKNENFNFIKRYILKNMVFNFIAKPDFISYCLDAMPNKVVKKFRKKGLAIGWTIKSKEELEKAKEYFDNFICENIL